jgi:hypothetical protein
MGTVSPSSSRRSARVSSRVLAVVALCAVVCILGLHQSQLRTLEAPRLADEQGSEAPNKLFASAKPGLTDPPQFTLPLKSPPHDEQEPRSPSRVVIGNGDVSFVREASLKLKPPPRALPTNQTRLHVITVQTKGSPGWCSMLRTAALSNIQVHNLAWGMGYGHSKRPAWIVEFLNNKMTGRGRRDGDSIDPWDVVLFLDGGDSAFTGFTPAEIIERFMGLTVGDVDPTLMEPSRVRNPNPKIQEDLEALQASMPAERMRLQNAPVPILFNAEANCFHQQLFGGVWAAKKSRCITTYKKHNPYTQSKWRYLNAGGWIGYAWAAKTLFADVKAVIGSKPNIWCDQSVIGGMYLSRKYSLLVYIDQANAIFMPTYHLKTDGDLCPTGPDDVNAEGFAMKREDIEAIDPGRGLRVCHTYNVPAVLHFNGKSEGGRADRLLAESRWASRARRSDKTREAALRVIQASKALLETTHGRSLAKVEAFADVCPGFAVLPPGIQ